jgi:hypothetical protein
MSRRSDVILMVIFNVTNRLFKTLVLNVILIQLSVSQEIQNKISINILICLSGTRQPYSRPLHLRAEFDLRRCQKYSLQITFANNDYIKMNNVYTSNT